MTRTRAGRLAPVAPLVAALPALLLTLVATGCGRGAPNIRTLASLPPVVMGAARVDAAIWMGSYAGLVRVAGGKTEVFAEPAGFPKGAQVRSVFPKGETLWLATNTGVVEFSLKTGKVARVWTSKDGLGAESVRWVGEVRGALWAGTIFGISRLAPGERRWKNYRTAQGLLQDHVYAVGESGNALWASCINGGLVRLDAARDRWEAVASDHGLGNKHIYAITATPNALWLGTAGGVNLYHTDTRTWDAAVCDDGFTDYCVRAVAMAGDDLWFGTSYGLYRRNLKTGRQAVYTTRQGLPDDEVTSIVPDGDRLLVTTRTGLCEVVRP
jgi:ligand-binding sensor domain-containing protein